MGTLIDEGACVVHSRPYDEHEYDDDDFYDKEEDEHDLVQYGYDSKITIDINDEQVEISISFDGGSSGDSIDPIPLQEFCDKLGLIKKEENK